MKYQLSSWPLTIAEFVKSDVSSDQENVNGSLLFSNISVTKGSDLRSQTNEDNMNPSHADAPEACSIVPPIDDVDVNTAVASIEGVEVTNTVSSVDGVPLSTTVVSLGGVPLSLISSNPEIGLTKGSHLRSQTAPDTISREGTCNCDAQIQRLTADNNATKAELCNLQTQLNCLQANFITLQAVLAAKVDKTSVETIQASLATKADKAAVVTIQTELITLHDQVNNLPITDLTTPQNDVKILQNKTTCIAGNSTAGDLIISGCDVHVVNGDDSSVDTNEGGNLIVSYNEVTNKFQGVSDRNPATDHNGSHNFMIRRPHTYNRYGCIVVGFPNEISGEYSSVSGDTCSTATGTSSSVSGGYRNKATAVRSSFNGRYKNKASGIKCSVSVGDPNNATGLSSSISGGAHDVSSGLFLSMSGGQQN